MKCPKCGHTVSSTDVFCGECGNKLAPTPVLESSTIPNTQFQDNEPVHKNTSNEQVEKTIFTAGHNTQPHVNNVQQGTPQSAPIINKEQVNEQSKALANEGKNFFSSAFKNTDKTIDSNNPFSMMLSGLLILAGLILIAILSSMTISEEVSYLGIDKSSLVTKLIIGLIIYLAVSIALTFGLTKWMIKHDISFNKVLSDYVLINTIPFIITIVGLLLIVMDVYKLGAGLVFAGAVLITYLPIYLFGKYTRNSTPKIPSIFAVLIYVIVMMIVLSFYSDTLIELGKSIFTTYIQNSMQDFTDGLFGQ